MTTNLLMAVSVAVAVSASMCDPVTCETNVQDDGVVIASDTITGSTEATGCEATVYLDSVGSDTTPSGAVRTLYTIDSVGSDTTPNLGSRVPR